MVRYKMIGKDIDSSFPQYRTWVNDTTPDYTASQYTGLKSGTLPLMDIVGYQIADEDIADFNLPTPLNWDKTYDVLPQAMAGSQFAIIDGYAYLFGAINSSKILRADINNPTKWIDTGATLPHALSSSQLAIIGSTVYLFGGAGTAESATDEVFSAALSDPLTWTNHGAILPAPLQKSALAYADGYIYLFGGMDKTNAVDIIWTAQVTDPLTWIDTGYQLPVELYGSTVAVLDNKIILLGGSLYDGKLTDTIYSANLSDPLTWTLGGHLPAPAAFGQFLTIGDQGYLFTQAETADRMPYQTRIFRCDRVNPFVWIDTMRVIPADLHQSQFGIIYDRIFAFGGNGITAIFSCNQILKYSPGHYKATQYAAVTRTAYQATVDPLDLNAVLGFPYWKTDYQQ